MKESVANIKPLYAVPEDANIMLRLEVDASKYGIGVGYIIWARIEIIKKMRVIQVKKMRMVRI